RHSSPGRIFGDAPRRNPRTDRFQGIEADHEAIGRFFEMGLTTPEVASISGHRHTRKLMHAHPRITSFRFVEHQRWLSDRILASRMTIDLPIWQAEQGR